MNMDIFRFELRLQLRQVSFWIIFAAGAVIGALAVWRAPEGSGLLANLTGAGTGLIQPAAPFGLFQLITLMAGFGLLAVASFIGQAALRDDRSQFHHLLASYPVSRTGCLTGRFLAALLVSCLALSGTGLGAWLAALLVFPAPAHAGWISPWPFIQPYFISVLPSVLTASAFMFVLALRSRRFLPVFTSLVFLIVMNRLAAGCQTTLSSPWLVALLDPLGIFAARQITSGWMLVQKNAWLVPLAGPLLANRLLWAGLALVVFWLAVRRYRFYPEPAAGGSKRAMDGPAGFPAGTAGPVYTLRESLALEFDWRIRWRQVLAVTVREWKALVCNPYFAVILLLGAGLVFFTGFRSAGWFRGARTLPVTGQLLEAIANPLYLLFLVVILFGAGEVVKRERDARLNDIFDILPVPAGVWLAGKLGALILVVISLMSVVMIGGMSIQLLKGFYRLEPGLYFQELFLIRLVQYVLIAMLAVFCQILFRKKILGYLVTLLLVDDFLESIGLTHHLFTFASTPGHRYSDMNGYGPFVKPLYFYNTYWISVAAGLLVLGTLLWVRGHDLAWRQRWRAFRWRFTRTAGIALGTAGIFTAALGTFIIWNTLVLNSFQSAEAEEKSAVAFEVRYKQFENRPQPVITRLEIAVELFPEEGRAVSRGRLVLENRSGMTVSQLMVRVPRSADIRELRLECPCRVTAVDRECGVRLFDLPDGLLPGGKTSLRYELERAGRGFPDRNADVRLVENGTFLTDRELMPTIGYNRWQEVSDPSRRASSGLPARPRLPSASDPAARRCSMLGPDAGWISADIMLSTSPDQIALTSGELVRQWQDGPRRYFHYRTASPILKYLPFLSARYEVRRSRWNQVALEIYYHPGHDTNLALMLEAARQSLDCYSRRFSPYQFQSLKIVEFPRYESFAEGFPGLIPLSEGFGFIGKSGPDEIPELFRLIAHETGHQWWPHQVVPGLAEGSFFLSETLAQYSALAVMEEVYRRDQVNEYCRFEIERYLSGRTRETEEEVPLAVSNQETWYVSYGKGFWVMHALRRYCGGAPVEAALRAFLQQAAFQGPPYAVSADVLALLKQEVPPGQTSLLEDWLENIIVYDLKLLDARSEKLPDGKYRVSLQYYAKKYRDDGLGRRQPVPVAEPVYFGAYGADGRELYLQRHRLTGESGTVEFLTEEKPGTAGIDPEHCLVEREGGDNMVAVTSR